jgi:hypothetical protein
MVVKAGLGFENFSAKFASPLVTLLSQFLG